MKTDGFSSLPQSTQHSAHMEGTSQGGCKTAESDPHSSPPWACVTEINFPESTSFSLHLHHPHWQVIFLTDTSKGVPAKLQIKILMKEKVLNSITDYFFLFSIFSYTFSFHILLFPTYSSNLSSYGKDFDLCKERLRWPKPSAPGK